MLQHPSQGLNLETQIGSSFVAVLNANPHRLVIWQASQWIVGRVPFWQFAGKSRKFLKHAVIQGLGMRHEELMADWQSGDGAAGNSLLRNVFAELKQIATVKLSRELHSSLSTGDLINEAVIRLSKLKEIEFQSREHILALASRIMRQVLVDQARKRNSDKRYHTRVTLATELEDKDNPVDLLELNIVLDELREMDPERADIVEMRYFGGMSVDDIAVVLGISKNTIWRRWAATRLWLQSRLEG